MDTSRQYQQKLTSPFFQFNLHIKQGIRYNAFRGGISCIFLHLKKNSASVPILTATNPLNETIITYQKLK